MVKTITTMWTPISIKNLLSYNYYFDDHKNLVGIAIAAHYSASMKYSCI